MMQLKNILLLALLPSVALATYGVDVSSAVSQSSWSCLKSDGYTFAIVRVYESLGKPDPNAVATIKNAHAAGITYVDGYIYPCYSCGNPSGQVSSAVSNLKNNGATIGQIWLDIEGSTGWSSTHSNNINFIQSMVDEAKSLGVTVAIYTSESQWTPITGGSTQFKSLQLWYAHYDGVASFSDFVSFGGWTTPAIKQYVGDATLCSVGIDKNWYP